MTLATITTASHFFVVRRVSARMRVAVNEMSRSLILWTQQYQGRGRPFKDVPDRAFVASNASRSEFRYHINHLETFKRVMARHQISDELIEWKKEEIPKCVKIKLVIQPHLTPRLEQVPAIEYITSPSSPVSKLLVLQTGKGKTLSFMMGAAILGDRVVAMLRPKYIEQWLRDFKKNCVIDPKRICVIEGTKGTKDLKSLMLMASEGMELPWDVFIISVETYRVYIDKYEDHGDLLEEEGYCVPPDKFFGLIKAGIRVIDEVHENFWFNFRLDLYTNIKNSVSLSATPQSDNTFINNMIKVAYPIHDRYDTGEYDRYATAYALIYNVRKPSDLRTLQKGMGTYSHVEFEKSIMKKRNTLDQYFKMVHDAMLFTYFVDYLPGNRCLVYFATIEMCGLFRDYIQALYPDMHVIRFVGGDSYAELQLADISISTIGSAGTGKDIPGLTAVVLTVAINSSPSNLQGFGRLRDLKDGRRMEFVYFVCADFLKHLDYHDRKQELLKTRALKYEKRYYGTMI